MRRLSRAAPPVKAGAVLTCRRLKRSERVLLCSGGGKGAGLSAVQLPLPLMVQMTIMVTPFSWCFLQKSVMTSTKGSV